MYLKKFIVHWSIGKTDRRRRGGAEGRSDHKNAPKTEPLKSNTLKYMFHLFIDYVCRGTN